jgi:hypothetical protein
MNTDVYMKMLADLERELTEINRDLARAKEWRKELKERRREVAESIDGINALLGRMV